MCAARLVVIVLLTDHCLGFYVAFGVGLILTVLVTIYHLQIVDWLTPATNWLHK